jgi:hypothetical protein
VKQLERRRDANSVDAAQNNKTALKEIALIDTQIDALCRDRRTTKRATKPFFAPRTRTGIRISG